MGFGDDIIATGIARGAAKRGKRIAFGNGRSIIWGSTSREVFKNNPNIAPPGSEKDPDIEWSSYCRGNRFYATYKGGRWLFKDYRCPEGEIFFTDEERSFARTAATAAVIIEPRVKPNGACAGQNKQWPIDRYARVGKLLEAKGWSCAQVVPPGKAPILSSIAAITTPSFRHALAILARAELYIGPEGGLHHGAAAVGTPAVVIWGGFNTPRSTGYPQHQNLTDGQDKPCGKSAVCEHCRAAMASISVERVMDAALFELARVQVA